jgi:transcriptional regulator with PAS, ATPase and Fis domain
VGGADTPRYFHLLSDAELQNLRPILELLRVNRDEVLATWHGLYREHFGDAGTSSEAVFRELYGRDLDAVVDNLLDGDMEGFEADVRDVGQALVEAGVPFAEVVVSLHLFEESAAHYFDKRLRVMLKGPTIYLTFDKLSHCRMILLAGTYFARRDADATQRLRAVEVEATALAGGPVGRSSFHGLVGSSAPMRQLYEQLAAAAGGQGAVFIHGESGTGKELAARALHECSGRASRPFVAVNCAALPAELIENELFGHRKGAYTGAQEEYQGLVRAAGDGTVFLDEITEMPANMQAKLLRVLEERTVRAVGSAKEEPVRARFVASTNRDPERAMESSLLRRDLWFRLSVHRIETPALRQCGSDVPALADHFARLLASRGLRRVEGFDADAVEILLAYHWPGNVRELRNAIEQALTAGSGLRVHRRDLPAHLVRGAAGPRFDGVPLPTYEQAERDLIRRALEQAGGNKVQAARALRISRHRLYDKLRRFGIQT